MTMNIEQHHPAVDFEAFFREVKSNYIGVDYVDYSKFLQTTGEKHSFIGYAQGVDRIKKALAQAISVAGAREILSRASALLIVIVRSPDAERPLKVEELKGLQNFAADMPANCDVVWGFAEDDFIGDACKVIILVNV